MVELNQDMKFPELDAYYSKRTDKTDKSADLAKLLLRGAEAYRGKSELYDQCLKAKAILPKEYQHIEFEKLPMLIEKCKAFNLKNFSKELIKCLIMGLCFHMLFDSVIASAAIFMICLVVLVGGGFITDRKNAKKLEAYYSLAAQLRGVFSDLELEEEYCSEEKLMRLYDIVQANALTSLKSAIEKLELMGQ